MVIGWITSLVLASVLVGAAVAKLLTMPASSVALADLLGGVSLARAARLARALALVELAVAVGILLRLPAAMPVTALLFAALACGQFVVLHRRGSGVPCGCFGPSSRITGWSATLTAAAAALATVIAVIATEPAGRGLAGWSVAIVALGALAASLLVARDLADRLAGSEAPRGALEIAEEGPPVGATIRLPSLPDTPPDTLRLAVFTSPGCALCRSLEPAVAAFAAHPMVTLTVHDEVREAEAWSALAIPGSPYAIACDAAGRVWAKGAFNTIGQLESVLATAVHRRDTRERRDHAA